ncbi:hypothetical protein CKO31_04675 [Thiohalocapsa halophila]|uniref:Dienelactone hydrolase domain-containing protein n=1 Tax=Thiohalocapsa halophila TaxID=69359 RepID=A0ABS1CDR8_9GAMM|nr:hypothetical protein [Thiohalocapsa halophila]MBK1630044.1 hypothetical protein [Thiohalocapsa halophila]
MQAIELETDIDQNYEIHLKLPDHVTPGKAKVLVLYDPPGAHTDALSWLGLDHNSDHSGRRRARAEPF